MKNIHKINENIYITSDEEIKEGDWLLIIDDFETYVHKHKGDNLPTTYHKKIILTTDELYVHNDLIPKEYNTFPKYIQKIDDEFLEWFVTNQGCEGVEIEKQYITPLGDIVETCYDNERLNYKIIIPKPTQQVIDEDFDGGLEMGQIIPKEEKMYTEQEVLVLLHKRDKHNWDRSLWQTPKEWFEQFKNK